MWELLLLIAVVVGVHWWEYQSSIQEYIFAQPATLDKHDELRTVLAEKTPIAVEIGSLPWRPEIATKAVWTVSTESESAEMDMSVAQWLSSGKPAITNQEALATEMELSTGLADLDGGRQWWWLPGLRDCTVDVLEPGEVLGLSWISAERHWIGCSYGGPLTLWLVHSRYRRFLPSTSAVDPWSLTVADAPWIGRVQYIEVTVRSGWAIGLPAHWGFAVRSATESWVWSADQHSALSLVL
jgi:hypothetical protein